MRGLHPGLVLENELKKRKLSKGRFAISINEFPQTLSAITNGKRNMNTALAMKIEKALDLDEGYFMILQVFYDIKEEKRKHSSQSKPDISKLRKALFWDTDINKIDWDLQKKAVITRVFERGTEQEKDEILRFYGAAEIGKVLKGKQETNR